MVREMESAMEAQGHSQEVRVQRPLIGPLVVAWPAISTLWQLRERR